MKISTRFSNLSLAYICLGFVFFHSITIKAQSCPTINEDGIFNPETDVLMTSYHQSMAKTTTGIVAWGEDMAANGGNANVITEVTPANGYNYSGTPLHFALSGNSDGQGFLATTVSLYAWGGVGEVVDGDFVSGIGFNDMDATQTLPFNSADITQMHASSDVLFVIAAGEVWVATTGTTAPSGNNSTNGNIWQQVQTSAGVPLTGVINITGNKYAGYALLSNGDIYTWGDNVVIGDGSPAQNLDFATLMATPPAPVKEISSFTHNDGDTGLLLLATDTKVYGVGDNTLGELITTGSGVVTSWTAIQDNSGMSDLTGVIQLSTTHTSEEWAAAAVLVEPALPSDPYIIYSWGWNNQNSIGQGGNAVIQNPTIPPSFNVGVDDPVYVSVGGHAMTFFNRAGGGSICFVGHITSGSTGGLTTGSGNVFECVIPATVELCGSQPTILALDDDFSGSPFDAITGGTTASVFADNGNGIDESDGSPATDANINDNINISNNGGLTGVSINTDGTIDVPAGATAGTYTVTYEICLNAPNETICTTANVIIELVANCDITAISSSNESVCNDNLTPDNISDDTFTADITVTFTNAPGVGTLDLSGDGTASVSVVGLTSPHTFTGVTLPANGSAISLTATFSDDGACTLTNNSVVNAPFECSDDECPDVIPPGSPSSALTAVDVTFDIVNLNDEANANLSTKQFNSITIAGEPAPFTDLLVPDNISYSYSSPSATNQRMINNGVDGAAITDGPAIFDPELIAANTDRNLNHYFRNDGNIFPTDYVNFEFNYDINSASNRYVIITERNGNNTMEAQAIDENGNVIGTPQIVDNVGGGTTTYIATGQNNDNGQQIYATVYPLTAFVGPNIPIRGIRLTQTGAPASGGDGGDGKVFIVYDPFFLTPPPTISLSTSFTQPVCPANEGTITIDATDNGGGPLEYSINGATGPWQASNVFNNVGPGTYNASVRYIGSPSCQNISPDAFTLLDAGCVACNISDITSSNIDPCDDNSTPGDITDDTFTADITVTFVGAPSTGTLDLSGDGSASVSVVGLTSPHTFVDVVLPADGGAIDLTATFSDDVTCTLNNTNVFTAPFECSDDACLDVIPPGNPTTALLAGDVTFDVNTGSNQFDPAILNFITVAGQPNPFTGIARPESTNYSFANQAAANQFITLQNTTTNDITQGPAIFDPALIEANSNANLRNFLSLDNGIESTDYVEFVYNSDITSASNRYVVVTERNGNNEVSIQALDNSLNLTGNVVTVTLADYINTGVPILSGVNVFAAIYPLTALVPSGTDIRGVRITQSGATGTDGGDGKMFILYDPSFFIPPPTIEATTDIIQPTCPTNLGSITIDATDNGGGTIEYSINGVAGPWQTFNVFNNLIPGTYTPAVRYQSDIQCVAVANSVTLQDSDFDITVLTASDITACNDNGTPSDITDDTFTADITVTYDNAPSSGTLDITGDITLSIAVGSLDGATSHVFDDVVLPANGNDLSFTATFSDAPSCTLTDSALISAPFECSDDACLDVIPTGNPTASLLAGDVTFDVNTGSNQFDPAILNFITVTGQPNPFTGIARPESTNYSFANPAAANQFITEQNTTTHDISQGPAIFDPALIEANSNANLRNYLALDNGIESTDYVEFVYNSDITSASNRYVVVTERNGNNEVSIQALDNSLNLTGNVVTVTLADYIDTGVPILSGVNVFAVIYPLTALVPSGTDIRGVRITQSGATGTDGGDGKMFILYDPSFFVPPPTIEASTSSIQPTCLSNLGTITVDATDNGGGTIEYSLSSLSGSNDQTWQTSNVFNNLPPDSYTIEVRYQATTTCSATSSMPIVLDSADCSISLIKSITSITSSGAPGLLDDIINYEFTITNTGDETLSNIVVTDPIVGTVTCVDSSLAPGLSTTCSASYTILQSDVDAGGVENSAFVTAEVPGGDIGNTLDDITDTSDTGTAADGSVVTDPETVETDDIDSINGDNNDADTTNDVTPFTIPEDPSIEAVKTVAITNDVAPVGASLGDTVEYTITVTNTGNVTLDGVAIADTFVDANGNPLTLLTGPTFVGPSSLGSAEGDLLVGEVATYTATYVIEQDAVDAGGFSNSVLADGDSPADTNV
ncbi:DUF7507 domain-containing protein, partial [Winogradskyella algicola]